MQSNFAVRKVFISESMQPITAVDLFSLVRGGCFLHLLQICFNRFNAYCERARTKEKGLSSFRCFFSPSKAFYGENGVKEML